MVQRAFLYPNHLKSCRPSVLLSNPLSKCEFVVTAIFAIGFMSFLLRTGSFGHGARISSNQRSGPIVAHDDSELLLLFAVASGLIGLENVRV